MQNLVDPSPEATASPADLSADSPPGGRRTDAPNASISQPAERGGPTGPEPTRYGDWEKQGRCIDF